MKYLVFDIGATTTRIAVSENGRDLSAVEKSPTPTNFEEAMGLFADYRERVVGDKKFQAVAGGIAGPLDAERARLTGGRNISAWKGQPLRDRLIEMFKTTVVLENDAAAAGLGEARLGAGQGHNHVAYITVSTGLGGTRIVNGRIEEGAFGFEPGRQIVNVEPELMDAETYISGRSLEKKYGKRPSEIDDPDVWQEQQKRLAYVLNNVIAMWSPEIIVLGGGVGLCEFISVDKLKQHLEKLVTFFRIPEIKKAALGDDAGLYGSLVLLKQ